VGCTALAAVVLASGGCRDRGAPETERPPIIEPLERRVELRLALAREWSWNDEDTLRIVAVNGTTDTVAGTLHLFVAAPADLVGIPPGMESVSSGEGTRVSLPVRLAPGETAELRQAVRTPPAPGAARPAAIDTTSRFPVRAWLAAADGRELAAREDTLRIRPGSSVVAGGCGEVTGAAVTRYGIGPVRLGMRASELRALCPEARDTAWRAPPRPPQAALAVRLAGAPLLALLEGDRVERIVLDSAGLVTAASVGVGSTLEALRTRYGRVCAALAEGRTGVWFPAAPGIRFDLDSAAAPPNAAAADLPALPDSARVERLVVRTGPDDCPRPAPPEPEPQRADP
jgi:hypothetical protein